MIRRTLLAAAVAAPALALVPAAPASAGCVEDLAPNISRDFVTYVSPSPTTWVTVSGVVVTIDGGAVLSDAGRITAIGSNVVAYAPGAATTFVDCVV